MDAKSRRVNHWTWMCVASQRLAHDNEPIKSNNENPTRVVERQRR